MTSLLLCLVLVASVPGSLDIDPALRWSTITTDHFAVHFPANHGTDSSSLILARRVAGVAEQVHARTTEATGWTPRSRTHVVVADFFDYANGWATPLPDNTITVIPTLPSGSRTAFDDWLRTLVAHEYAHIVQMDMVRGFPAALRRVFGRIALTNPLMPIWLLEGYAQKMETDLTNYGRLRGSEYDMMLRVAARSGRLLPIDQCGGYELERHPAGVAPYLYGGMFIKWLRGRSGAALNARDRWNDFNRARSAGIPFFEDLFAEEVFDSSFSELWPVWLGEVEAHADSTATAVSANPVTPLVRLRSAGHHVGRSYWSSKGDSLYYVSKPGTEYPSIRTIRLGEGEARLLHRGRIHGTMSLSPNGNRLAFGQHSVLGSYYDYSDIVELDLTSGETRQLTQGMRARDPDYGPDGERLAFVVNHHGTNDLMILDLTTLEARPLTGTNQPTGYTSPRFSPDGRLLAVCINRPEGRTDIELVDLENGWSIPVTDDRANDLSPSWSSNGKLLFFISDRTGVFNLYAYSVVTGQTRRCTNVIDGVFDPSVSPDGLRIALTTCGSRGEELGLLRRNEREWSVAEPFDDTLPCLHYPSPSFSCEPSRYSPLPSLAPKLWAPLVSYDGGWRLGAFTFGWDALQFHRYVVAGGWDLSGKPFLSLDYTLSRYRVIFDLNAEIALAGQTAVLAASLPFRSDRRATGLGFSTEATYDSLLATRFALSATTTTAFQYRFQVGPTEGYQAGLSSHLEASALSGRYDRNRVLGYLYRYWGVGRNASLRAGIAAGTAFGTDGLESAWTIDNTPGVLGVRGFQTPVPESRSVLVIRPQLRMPIAWVERGLGTSPLFLRNLNLSVFADGGAAWQSLLPGQLDGNSVRVGLGVELGADLVVAHVVPLEVRAGVAAGAHPEPGKDWQLYLTVGSALLEGLLGRVDATVPAGLLSEGL